VQHLPVDDVIPEVIRALRKGGSAVVEAPPGAGKTTRIPWAVMKEFCNQGGEVLVLEPRRLPARLAAHRVSSEHGEKPGGLVGYVVRFEEVSGPYTRLRFLTEGILARRLLSDPLLAGVSAVIFDEFHERHIYTDLSLALVRRLQLTGRPDLKIVAMSATLDAAGLADWLGAGKITSEGRLFDVGIEYLERDDARPIHELVAAACRDFCSTAGGDLLAFLPGTGEISRSAEALSGFAGERNILLCPLHGEMTLEAQNRAVTPADRRKIVLSTNVAETSVTIEGVTGVIDSGLARVASHSPWSGLPVLKLTKTSKASAVQRSGRAGRTGPGSAIRLYTKADFDRRRDYDLPEVKREDLAEAVLFLKASGVKDTRSFGWFEAPFEQSISAAEELLERLGALAPGGGLSETGKRMSEFPLHPRLARVAVEGERRGEANNGFLAASILSERDIRAREKSGMEKRSGGEPADMEELMDLAKRAFSKGHPGGAQIGGVDRRAIDSVFKSWSQLKKLSSRSGAHTQASQTKERVLEHAVLSGFPDRVARLRGPGTGELLLSSGGTAELPSSITGSGGTYFVVPDAEERVGRGTRSRVVARIVSSMEPEWLIEHFPERVVETERLEWNGRLQRVDRLGSISYDSLVIDESASPAPPSADASAILAAEAARKGIERLDPSGAVAGLLARIAFLKEISGKGKDPFSGVETALDVVISRACEGLTGMDDLLSGGLDAAVLRTLPPSTHKILSEMAPDRITLPGGRSIKVHYEPGQQPWAESYLQDFFGMQRTPAVAGGRAKLTLRLLAPSRRPVQVTTDLEGFWKNHYPAVRKELSRRYPRHSWPEDGAMAKPTGPGRRR
jgi:ATP-dependent helicase HrpB